MHYAPITSHWRNCCGADAPGDFRPSACWHGIRRDTRVYKLEDMSRWYAPLVQELGLAKDTQDRRWKRGCFYRPPNGSCADALKVPMEAEVDGRTRSRHTKTRCVADAQHMRTAHVMHSCNRLAEFYTPELAAIVTATFRGDLERFDYPEWNGDVANPWH